MDGEEALMDRVLNAVRSELTGYGELGNRVVVLAETMDEYGKRGLWVMADQGSTPWDTLGMLEAAKARAAADMAREDD